MKGGEEKYVEVIGEICLDIIMHNPRSVEVLGENIWAENITITPGGSAVFVSAVLAHLGEYVKIRGSIGDDDEGKKVLKVLHEINIDCSNVTILKDTRTTLSMIICEGDQKNFIGCSPMIPLIMPGVESLRNTKLIYVAGYMLYQSLWTDESLEYFRQAHKLGIPIVIDGQCSGSEPFDKNLDNFIPLDRTLSLCSVFFAAKKDLFRFNYSPDGSAEAAQLLKTGLKTAVLKRGHQGAMAFNGNGKYCSAGYHVDAYDAVGSGDIFGAAYTHGFINGWSTQQCLEFSNIFAALSILKYKDRKQFPCIETVSKIIKERGIHFA